MKTGRSSLIVLSNMAVISFQFEADNYMPAFVYSIGLFSKRAAKLAALFILVPVVLLQVIIP